MSFLLRVAGLSLRDRVRSSAIWEELGVEPLLLRVERSQMRWLGHLVRMPPGRLPGEVFRACPFGQVEDRMAGRGEESRGERRGEERRGEERRERRGEERRGEEGKERKGKERKP
ncbi:hypothetical protein D4764_15G0007690 [Takifugu flavidus]|uniref:Uncharacterized protein n=1 Tax=Takifugu flavidus TaxID=433684 RepID=A0A5C6P230_9TELE|nr:hypothetical protein D4764_15G0007690 [Takifugu flavidus]